MCVLLTLTLLPIIIESLTINTKVSPEAAINNLRTKYERLIGHDVLTPAVEDLAVTPIEASQCAISRARLCYVPLPQLVSHMLPSLCLKACWRFKMVCMDLWSNLGEQATFLN